MTTSQESNANPGADSPGERLLLLAETCWMQGDEVMAEILIDAAARRGKLTPEGLVWQAVAQFNVGKFQSFWSTLARAQALLPSDPRLASMEELVGEMTRTYTFSSKTHLMQIQSAADFLNQFPERGEHLTVCQLNRGGNSGPLRVNIVSNVYVVGPEGTVVDPQTSTIFSNSFSSMEHNEVVASNLTPQVEANLADSINIPGHTVHLCGKWSGNFFHWMSELLPRAFLLEQAGFSGSYMVPRCGHAFIPTSLEMLGISADRIITNYVNRPVFCEKTLMFDSFWFTHHYENQWIMLKLRELLLKQVDTTSLLPDGAQGLYIMRRGNRAVRNHEAVYSLLSEHGIMAVYAEDLSLQEQISLAARSRFIFGPHGSGLTLALFMQPESTFVEFLPSNSLNLCYDYLAHLLNYRHLTIPSAPDPWNAEVENVEPSLGVLKQVLRRELGSSNG